MSVTIVKRSTQVGVVLQSFPRFAFFTATATSNGQTLVEDIYTSNPVCLIGCAINGIEQNLAAGDVVLSGKDLIISSPGLDDGDVIYGVVQI